MTTRYALTGMFFAIALTVGSCQREADAPAEGRDITIHAVAGESTRTAYEGEKTFSWVKGDVISLQTAQDAQVGLMTLSANEAGAATTFSGTVPAGFIPGETAFYPQDLAKASSDGLTLELPASFTPDAANPMAVIPLIGRKGTDGGFAFRTATGILKLTVSDIPADVVAIGLVHETAVLCGTFALPEGDALEAAKASVAGHSVSALYTPAELGETRSFFFPLPVGEIPAGLQVVLKTTANGDMPLAVTSQPITIARNQVVAAAELGAPDPDTMIHAHIDMGPGTKTTLAENDILQWMKGDEIDAVVVNQGVYTERRYQSIDAGQEARFLLTTEETSGSLELSKWAFYPSRTSVSAQNDGYNLSWDIRPNYYEEDKASYPEETELITIDLPATLSFPAGNPICVLPMLGQRQEDQVYHFKPMTGVMALTVTGMPEGLDFVSIKAPGMALAGSFHLDQASGTVSQNTCVGGASETITFTFSQLGENYTFYLPVVAGTYPTLTIDVGSSKDPDSAMEVYCEGEALVLNAGEIMTVNLPFKSMDQQWTAVTTEATYLDDFLWGQHSAYTSGTPVKVTLERSGLHPNKYRINNPYTVANAQFGYTPHTEGIVADDYFVFSLHDDGIVRFQPFLTGIEDLDSGGRPMLITHSLDWSSTKTGKESRVVSALKDGTPLEIQLGAVFSDPDDETYMYTRDGEGNASTQRIHIVIPDDSPETWDKVAQGEFIDDLLWPYHGWGTSRVAVMLEQSSKVPTKFRVANPYLQAAREHNYTPYTSGIEGAEYIELSLLDNNLVRFATFLAGIEDKPSGGKPMKIWYPSDWGSSYDVSYNKVLSWRPDHLPAEIQLAAMYSDPVTVSYKYTKYNVPTMHFYFPDNTPEEVWENAAGSAQFLDSFIWGRSNNFTAGTYVDVTLQKSTTYEGRYRIANPYLAAAAKFGYTVPSGMATPDEYLVLTIDQEGLVTFPSFVTGVNLDASKSLTITHPTEWATHGGTSGNAANNKVTETQEDGTPGVITLEPIFHESGNYKEANTSNGGYYYPPNGSRKLYIRFPGKTTEDNSDKVVVTHQVFPMMPGSDLPIAKLTIPGSTLTRVKARVTGCDVARLEGLRLWSCSANKWIMGAYLLPDQDGIVTMDSFTDAAIPGQMDLNIKFKESIMGQSVALEVLEVVSDGTAREILQNKSQRFLPGVLLNNANDIVSVRGDSTEKVAAFRIPALVTSKDGKTLIAAYDVRYDGSGDLQADIDVGVKRSTDGGKTWSALQLAMDMGIYGYEADVEAKTMKVKQANKLNGIGDPCLVTDEVTGDIFCFGLWAHGHEGQASLNYSTTSYEVDDTPQFVVVKSSDDGQTWSEPVNITRQVKRPDWRACFQGPGRGITMKDGTIVIPFQFQKGPGKGASLNSTVVYSTDHGQTWHCHNSAHTVTSECAVAEIEPGVLLLTMRDETNSHYRRNFITKDLGRTWTAHETNGKWLEPTCEASLLHVDAKDNVLNRDILLFSNPNSNGRDHITIKASLDQGKTFCGEQLLDSGGSWGYTCLTMVDRETVGILYESSKGHMMFQAIPLTDLIQ